MALAPDKITLFTSSLDMNAKMWDIETGMLLRTFTGH